MAFIYGFAPMKQCICRVQCVDSESSLKHVIIVCGIKRETEVWPGTASSLSIS